ncbi:glycoside hydrolase family 16 protein [Modestobacter italicus]|uniref:glycoside hydrolase family 16 protein n=1 Tax=Modestobacter italicus (strain DSM 44449 / CECT 9708 / BC 501) TaxID=2732864 RepID=UPI001C95280A|nr:glycoside hydrolase family 16 protein [Modestobacter italicus]
MVLSVGVATGQGAEPTGQTAGPAAPVTGPTTPTASPSTDPAPVPEWTPLIDQDFDEPAALGEFADVYPGWASYDGWYDTEGPGLYDSSRVVTVSDGILNEHLHTEDGEALVVSITPVPHVQTYGRYEVRFRTDPVPGYKIAWLLWPADDNWLNGEIDFPEAGLDPGDVIEGFSHRVNVDEGNHGWTVTTDQSTLDWHTAVIEWRPDSVTFILDGVEYRNTDPGSIPTVPMYWSMQTEAGDPAASVAGNVQIDYVRAWSYTGLASTD